jgi:hypothetical protein
VDAREVLLVLVTLTTGRTCHRDTVGAGGSGGRGGQVTLVLVVDEFLSVVAHFDDWAGSKRDKGRASEEEEEGGGKHVSQSRPRVFGVSVTRTGVYWTHCLFGCTINPNMYRCVK